MHRIMALALIMTLLAAGCGKKPPEVIEVAGQVLLNGTPLPSAEVRFIPMHPGLDGNFISHGVTDADGRFELSLMNGTKGACVCNHQVLVMEGPLPDEARGMSDNAQTIAVNYMQGLKNRPIPDNYGDLVRSPLKVEVTKDQDHYEINLAR